AVHGLWPRNGNDASFSHGAPAALGPISVQALRRYRPFGHNLLRFSRHLHRVRCHIRAAGLARSAAGADRVRADARRAVVIAVGLHSPSRELCRCDEFCDVSNVLLLFSALSAVEAAAERIAMGLYSRDG